MENGEYQFFKKGWASICNATARVTKRNRFSLLMSIGAFMVSVTGVSVTYWQAKISMDQMVSANRNNGFENLVNEIDAMCDIFYPNRLNDIMTVITSDRDNVIVVGRKGVSEEIYDKNLNSFVARQIRKIHLAFTIAEMWSRPNTREYLFEAESIIDSKFYPLMYNVEGSDQFSKDSYIRKYASAAAMCTDNKSMGITSMMSALITDNYVKWIDVRRGTEVAVLDKVDRENIDYDEMLGVAIQQKIEEQNR